MIKTFLESELELLRAIIFLYCMYPMSFQDNIIVLGAWFSIGTSTSLIQGQLWSTHLMPRQNSCSTTLMAQI